MMKIMRLKKLSNSKLLSFLFVLSISLFSAQKAIASTGVLENFEGADTGWAITKEVSSGGTISSTTEQASSSASSAKLLITGTTQVAKISYSFNDGTSHVWNERPGTYNWQRARVYIPSSVVNAIGANGYITIGQMWSTTTNSGWSLRVKQGGQLYVQGRRDWDNSLIEFNVYGTVPTNQWFDLELGLHSQNGPGVKQAFAFLINGEMYGFYHQGKWLDSYNKASIGLINTNVTGNLSMYIDDWGIPDTSSNPTGTDNRPSSNVFEKDYRDVSGKNWQIDWTTWDQNLILSPTAGIFAAGGRFQSGFNQDKMPDLTSGWGEIEIGWTNGFPTFFSGADAAPMIGMRKELNKEQNLELIPYYNTNGTVSLVFEAWTDSGPVQMANWLLPIASYDGTSRIPEQGDIIRGRWEQVSSTDINVKASYYDASTTTWYNDIINHTFNASNVNSINFNDGFHKASSITTDNNKYSIRRYKVGTLDTFPGTTQNQNPTVSITSPISGQSFFEGNLTISANATDPDGNVSKVEFFDDSVKLGESLSAPFSYNLNAVGGTYNLTARATDNLGATANSSVVTINVYSTAPVNQLPSTSITSPISGQSFFEGEITINASATDPDGTISKVEFFDGGAKLGESLSEPFSYLLNAVAGTYNLTTKATDNVGATAVSSLVTINVYSTAVQNQNPNGVIDTPSSNVTIVAGSAVNFTGTASDPDNNTPFTYLWNFNGGATNSTVEDPGSVVFNTAGVYNVTFTVTDSLGASDSTPDSVTVTVNAPVNQPPTATITSPLNGASFPVGNITINANATDPNGSVNKVEFFNSTTKLGEDLSIPYSLTFSAISGTYNLTARATDNLGATGNSSVVTINVYNTIPQSGTIEISATQVVNQNNSTYTTSSPWIGNASSTNSSYLGARFANVNIPANASITSAKLEFTVTTAQWVTKNVNVYNETGSSPVFSSGNLPSARPLSSLITTSNDNVNSPAGSKITITLPPASLNINNMQNINFILKGTGSAFARKFIYGSGAGANTPKLTVTYTTP